MVEIGIKDERYLILQIDLHNGTGTEEAGQIIGMMMNNQFFEKGQSYLHECMSQVLAIHKAKCQPN